MIKDFLASLNNNSDDCLFTYAHRHKLITKTKKQFLDDVGKMSAYLKDKGINPKEKILCFLKPSYLFYVLIASCFTQGITVVVLDSFKNKAQNKALLQECGCCKCFVSNQTKYFKSFFLGNIKKINIAKYSSFSYREIDYVEVDSPLLITFSSGSSATPKIIERDMLSLQKQFSLIANSITIPPKTNMLAMLPIYVLANMMHGVNSVVVNNFREKHLAFLLKEAKVEAIAASVSKYVLFTNKYKQIKMCFTGGSLISYLDCLKIKNSFPNALFTYTYGASEAVMIASTTLDFYLGKLKEGKICCGNIVSNVEVKIVNPASGIGEIAVRGEAVLASDWHLTGDIGYLEDGLLYLVGKKKLCVLNSDTPLYNYLIENEIYKISKAIRKCAFIPYNDYNYLLVEGPKRIKKQIEEECNNTYKVIVIKKIPVDARHNYKINYNEVINILKERV